MSETYTIDGTDVLTIAQIASYAGLYDVPDLRGDDWTIPNRHGVEPTARPFSTSVLTLQLELIEDTLTARNDALRALTRFAKPGKVVTGTRVRDYTSGSETHTARLRYLSGLDPSEIDTTWARIALAFTVLDGLWYGSSVVDSISGTDSVNAAGDVDTRRITLVLPGAGTLTNTTTGTSLTVTAGATVDVEAKTTTGLRSDITAVGDPLGFWFTLAPGTNAVSWSGGSSVAITYYPAHT